MTPAVLIRPAAPQDADAVLPLAVELATSARPTPEGFAAMYRTILTDPRCLLLVAETEGRVVGYLSASVRATFHADGLVAWVDEIVVEPAGRGHGTGAALMRSVEAWARSTGARTVSLATRRAGAFYEALGYTGSATYYKKPLADPGP